MRKTASSRQNLNSAARKEGGPDVLLVFLTLLLAPAELALFLGAVLAIFFIPAATLYDSSEYVEAEAPAQSAAVGPDVLKAMVLCLRTGRRYESGHKCCSLPRRVYEGVKSFFCL